MDDKFLYQNQPVVRQEFAENLYRRISNQKGTIMKTSFSFAWKVAIAVMFLLGLTLTFSGSARAAVMDWIKNIAGFNVAETRVSPLQNLGENEPVATTIVQVTPTVFPVATQSVPETLANMPFAFSLPAYVPEGYKLSDDVGIANSKAWVALRWEKADGSEIQMLVQQEYTGFNIPAGVDSAEEIQVNGQKALLIRGWWDENHVWDKTKKVLQVHWIKEQRYYMLEFWNMPTDSDLETLRQTLVKMAESVK